MAETEAATHAAGKGFDALKQKVGPLPLYAWLAIFAGVWYYFQKKNTSSTTGATGATPNQQTDPAGNIGTIDPATGYVYGTPEDLAALAANNSTGTGSSTVGGTSGSTVAGQYTDNNSWGVAAINYLVGIGIDPTTANEAIESYLASQSLTANQQADVNLAIQALGAPPQPPGPVGNNPSPVAGGTGGSGTTTGGTIPPPSGGSGTGGTPGAGTGSGTSAPTPPSSGSSTPVVTPPSSTKSVVTATNPVTGLVISQKNRTSLQVKWNAAKNATGYHILCTDSATKAVTNQFDVPASQTFANCGGLTSGHMYVIDVWAEPEPGGRVGTSAHAHVSVTLPKTG